MAAVLGIFGLVFILIFGIMSFALMFSGKNAKQTLVAVTSFLVLCGVTYLACKYADDTDGGLFLPCGLLWAIVGNVVSSWMDFNQVKESEAKQIETKEDDQTK